MSLNVLNANSAIPPVRMEHTRLSDCPGKVEFPTLLKRIVWAVTYAHWYARWKTVLPWNEKILQNPGKPGKTGWNPGFRVKHRGVPVR